MLINVKFLLLDANQFLKIKININKLHARSMKFIMLLSKLFFINGTVKTALIFFRIEGGELFERVISDDFVLTEKACSIFVRQICEGVEYMHSKNVLHLDMKVNKPFIKFKVSLSFWKIIVVLSFNIFLMELKFSLTTCVDRHIMSLFFLLEVLQEMKSRERVWIYVFELNFL